MVPISYVFARWRVQLLINKHIRFGANLTPSRCVVILIFWTALTYVMATLHNTLVTCSYVYGRAIIISSKLSTDDTKTALQLFSTDNRLQPMSTEWEGMGLWVLICVILCALLLYHFDLLDKELDAALAELKTKEERIVVDTEDVFVPLSQPLCSS
jgi:hypothetical protein